MAKAKDYNIKSIRKQFKKQGIFYTPIEVVKYMMSFIDIDFDEVYDPTVGHGSLLSLFDKDIKKYGQDVSEEAINGAKEELDNFIGEVGNTLREDKFKDRKFKLIMANPPFSIEYDSTGLENDERFKDLPTLAPNSKGDFMFIFHCLAKLKDDGMAIILNFPGIAYRKNREYQLRKYLIDKNYVDKVVEVGGKQFEDTKISTLLLVLRKNKTNTDILFKSQDIERVVALDEIIENDYSLSVNTYVNDYDEKKPLMTEEEAIELQHKAHEEMFNYIVSSLRFEQFVYNFHRLDFKKHFNNFINRLIREFKEIE